ncbi:MAG: drug/metabolite transporter (DMT)-like permease [Paracoccaceae bacterium]|jgi:drug/metabolite transporter (DMT)-like permease
MTAKEQGARNLPGIGLMLAAMATLPFLDVIAKFLGQQHVPIIQIVWARIVFSALITLPFAARISGFKGLLPRRPIFHSFRAIFLISATFFFFFALKFMSIADTLSIFFVQPLIVTALSPFVLKEHVGPRRWTAVFIGFIGTLIIIRPGFQTLNEGVILALAAGASLAFYILMTRRVSGQNHAMVTTFQTNLMGAIIVSICVTFYWLPPSLMQWVAFVFLAFIAVAGHYLIVRAYDYCEASLLAPFAYTEMIMATLLGWYFFSDLPDYYTFFGVSILIVSAIYISLREHQNKLPPHKAIN